MAAAKDGKRIAVDGKLTMGHKGPAVEVVFDPQAEWGIHQAVLWPGRRGYPVEVLLNGVRFRSAIVSRMRRFFVLVEESLVRRAGVRVGSSINLMVWPDVAQEVGAAGGSAVGREVPMTTRFGSPALRPGRTGNEPAKKARRRTRG